MSSFIPFWTVFFAIIASFYLIAKYLSLYWVLTKSNINSIKRDWDYKPKISITMSCFNEGEAVYQCIKSIIQSDYLTNKIEIVAYDDHSKDDTFEWLKKAQSEWPKNIIIHRNAYNKGKPHTMVEMSSKLSGEIIICTDSDMIFHKDAIKELISCFSDSSIGAVGAQIRIRNVNDSWLTQIQTLYYTRIYYFYKTIENLGLTARCLTGQCAAYRREIYIPLMKQVLNRNFMNIPISYGEDTFLTSHVVFNIGLPERNKRWNIFTNLKAICWTDTPTGWKAYMNQQMRWRRGTFMNGFRTFWRLWYCLKTAGILSTLIHTIPTLAAISLPIMALFLLTVGDFLQAYIVMIITLFIYAWGAGLVYNLTIGRADPYGKLKNPMGAGITFAIWYPVNIWILTIVALFTLDDGGWVTRQNQSNTG